MSVYLPGPFEVRELLEDLLGRQVTVETSAPLAPGPRRPATFGVYVDDTLLIRAMICLDLPLSAYAGAAIGLVPPKVAEEAVALQQLTPLLTENLGEVLNIAVTLFNQDNSDHLRLHAVYPAGSPPPGDVHGAALTLGRRTDLSVSVAGYGSGALSLVIVRP